MLTKPPGTGGRIDLQTVKEQLLYEIHDPAAYLTPDVTLDVTGVRLIERGPDRVRVEGARGHPAPERLKATVSYLDDWLGEAEISYAGPNARARAELAVATIRERLARARAGAADARRSDRLSQRCSTTMRGSLRGAGDGADAERPAGPLRLQRATDRRVVRAAVQEVNALYCCGPAGGGGVADRGARTGRDPVAHGAARPGPRRAMAASGDWA